MNRFTPRLIALVGLLICCCVSSLRADSLSVARYGLFAGGNVNMHSAGFAALPGVANCCPEFQSGGGGGFAAGLVYEFPFLDAFELSARAGLSTRGARLTEEEAVLLGIDGQSYNGLVEHSIDAGFTVLAIEPLAVLPLGGGFDALAGFDLGLVLSNNFEQQEQLLQPSNRGVFDNGSRVRNQAAGDIPDAAGLLMGLDVGLRYRVPLDEAGSWTAAPEALFSYGLTPLVSGLDWNVNTLRLGVAVLYRPSRSESVMPPPPVQPRPSQPIAAKPPAPEPDLPPVLDASLRARAVGSYGAMSDTLHVRVDEISTTVGQPLLPFVFFDDGSSTLPMRYERLNRSETDDFSEDSLYRLTALQRYRHVLNIIGKRLRDKPTATIEIRGYNADRGAEKNGRALSRGRAEAVREYLWDTWNIEPRRMKVGAGTLPPDFSNPDHVDGQAENRRVEITSNDWDVLGPLMLEEFDRSVTPASMALYPQIEAEAGVDSYEMMVYDGDRIIRRVGDVGVVQDSVLVDLPDSLFYTGRPDLRYEMAVADKTGQSFLTPVGSMPVATEFNRSQLFEGGVEVGLERYSLVVFPFNRATLNAANLDMIEFVRDRLTPESRVIVRGYSDRMGEADYNEELSFRRADAVAHALGAGDAVVQGIGESVLLHDNSLPEGRLYSRSVVVLVKSPKH